MKRVFVAALALCSTVVSLSAHAQFRKPDDAIEYRQGAFFVMGNHFSRIGAMATGKAAYDANAVKVNAEIVAMMAKLPWAGFIDGTESGHGTRAKAEVWSEADKFKDGAMKMQEATQKLNAAAQAGDEAQVKVAFGEAAKTCKACHDNFRKD